MFHTSASGWKGAFRAKIFRILKDPVRLLAYGAVIFTGVILLLSWRHLKEKKQDLITDNLQSPLVISSGAFSGAPLYIVLADHGISSTETYKISSALKKVLNPRALRKEDEYALVRSTSGTFRYITISRQLKYYSVFKGRKGNYVSRVSNIPLDLNRKNHSGSIENSLWLSMRAEGVSPLLILEFADIFSCDIDFLTEVRKGDRYFLIWEESSTPDGEVVKSRILAAAYRRPSLKAEGEKTGILFEGDYYNKEGKSQRKFFLRAPLQYRRISSYFSKRRFHPILRYFRPHFGIDYAAPTGTPVSAVADGRVTFVGWKGSYGRYIKISHSNSYVTTYGHLRRYAKGMRRGVRVKQGKVIGYVGSSGVSTGPHLHFMVKKNGKYINFFRIKSRSVRALSKKKLRQFKESITTIRLELEKLLSESKSGASRSVEAES